MNNQDNSYKREKKRQVSLKKFILPLIIIIIIIIIILLLRGKNTVTGTYHEDVHTKTMVCEKEGDAYDKVIDLSPETRKYKVNMIFDETDKLQSVSFRYIMTFGSAEQADTARHSTSVTFAESLNKYGYSFNEFSNKLTNIDKDLTIELYAEKDDITRKAASFFKIALPTSSSALPVSMEEYRKNYTDQGFACDPSD